MYQEPESSPWGRVQTCDVLCPGVFLVSTASHGGTMVAPEMAAVLSPAARRCGFKRNGYICFEEDSQESVVLRELLDKKLWKIPDRIKDKAAFEEGINRSIKNTTRNTGGPDSPELRRRRLPAPQRRRSLQGAQNDKADFGPNWSEAERRILWPMCQSPMT